MLEVRKEMAGKNCRKINTHTNECGHDMVPYYLILKVVENVFCLT